MSFQELLISLKGHRTQREFCSLTGLSEGFVSRLLSGEKSPGAETWAALTTAFPERSEEIARVFLSTVVAYRKQTLPMGDAPTEVSAPALVTDQAA